MSKSSSHESSHILMMTPVLITVLAAIAALTTAHAFGIAFESIEFPASGVLSVHCILLAGLLHIAQKRLRESYQPNGGWEIAANVLFQMSLTAMS